MKTKLLMAWCASRVGGGGYTTASSMKSTPGGNVWGPWTASVSCGFDYFMSRAWPAGS